LRVFFERLFSSVILKCRIGNFQDPKINRHATQEECREFGEADRGALASAG